MNDRQQREFVRQILVEFRKAIAERDGK